MKRSFLILFVLLVLIITVAHTTPLEAQTLQQRLTDTATGPQGAGFSDATDITLPEKIGAIIKIFLSLVGVIFVYLLVNGGYKYMTASGEEENIKKAKQEITAAVIGLIIVAAAWSISQFVLTNLVMSVK